MTDESRAPSDSSRGAVFAGWLIIALFFVGLGVWAGLAPLDGAVVANGVVKVAGDDTDGHVDDLARFVATDTIVTVVEQDPVDANYHALQDNLRRLRAMRDASGRTFRIETLPMPSALLLEWPNM